MMDHAARRGTVRVEGGAATMTFERHLRHPPEEVWDALTGAEHLQHWYMTKARIEPRPGGSVEFFSGPAQVHVTGRVLVWDPPRVFEHERNVAPSGWVTVEERSVIRWELTPEPGGTLLRMTHRRLDPRLVVQIAPAVHGLLDRLEAGLDGGPLPDLARRMGEVRALYPATPDAARG
jgi:uncharacterized protein YndB with AHSA1/START domain